VTTTANLRWSMDDNDKPRPKAPTLAGVAPVGRVVVVGALGHAELPPTHSVETQRMIFEPMSAPDVGAAADSGDALDDEWPDEPPPSSISMEAAPQHASGPPEPAAPPAPEQPATALPPVAVVAPRPTGEALLRSELPTQPSLAEQHAGPEQAADEPAKSARENTEPTTGAPVKSAPAASESPANVEPEPPRSTHEADALHEPSTTGGDANVETPVRAAPRRRPWLWAAAVTTVLVAGGVGAWKYRPLLIHLAHRRAPAAAAAALAPPASPAAVALATSPAPRPIAAPSDAPSSIESPASSGAATAASPSAAAQAPDPSQAVPPPPIPMAAFNAAVARDALDPAEKAVSKCRHGRLFGPIRTTVTFGNDGAVNRCAVSVPFAGTPAGACVIDAVSGVHMPPFFGKLGTVIYKFNIAEH